MSAVTKNDVDVWAQQKGIELDDDGRIARDREGNVLPRHIHAYAPKGFKFANTDTHNQSLGTFGKGERPNWFEIYTDLRLEPCTDPECEYCHEESES